MQKDFIDGSLRTKEAQAIVPKVVEKIREINKENTLILFTKDTHHENYLETLEWKMLPIKHCIENTPGWRINKEISSEVDNIDGMMFISSDKIIHSRIYKNTFRSDVLENFLVGNKNHIEEIEFVGLCSDICVVSNALMARQKLPNTKIVVDASCCA